jgi:twitching motility two-component system response regulator PilH
VALREYDVNRKVQAMAGQKHILVVDDSEESRLFLSEILEENGYECHVANNAEEALQAVHEHHFDLILLDVMMPRKSGIFVFKEIKKDPALEDIPIIVITGATEATGVDIRTGEEEPLGSFVDQYPRAVGSRIHKKLATITPDALLEKPLDPPTLGATIKEILERPQHLWMGSDI